LKNSPEIEWQIMKGPLKTGSFPFRTQTDHLNNGLVWYSDGHCNDNYRVGFSVLKISESSENFVCQFLIMIDEIGVVAAVIAVPNLSKKKFTNQQT
jgi:hypothetical protein